VSLHVQPRQFAGISDGRRVFNGWKLKTIQRVAARIDNRMGKLNFHLLFASIAGLHLEAEHLSKLAGYFKKQDEVVY
jgi:hypothetical protein